MGDPVTLAILAGVIIGGGSATVDQQRAATRKRRRNRRQDSLEQLFQNSLAEDPLLRNTIGQSLSAAQQGPFNQRKVFRDASQQIQAAASSKQQQSLQQLAGLGFERGSEQQKFLKSRIDRSAIRQTGAVSQYIQQARIQAGAQEQFTGTTDAVGSVLGAKQLQVSAL